MTTPVIGSLSFGTSNLGFEDLDAFLQVALTIPDNTYVRVKVVSFDNQPLVLAVKANHHYFICT